jgi:glycosyltransferase involved in cell wall biosynthesis
VSGGSFRTLVADLMRLALGPLNAWRAWRELGGRGGWVYERSAVLQAMGWIFKRDGGPWILETNAPLFYEAKVDRNSIVLSGLARWLELRAYRECDVLVCVSEALKEILVREAGLQPEKVVVVPNGVDTIFFDPNRYTPMRMFEGFTIGFVGHLSAWQGLDLLLEALKDLRAEGIDASLVVVGDGPMRQAWEAQARRLGINYRERSLHGSASTAGGATAHLWFRRGILRTGATERREDVSLSSQALRVHGDGQAASGFDIREYPEGSATSKDGIPVHERRQGRSPARFGRSLPVPERPARNGS